ncbi:membrane protein insertion efficiency factor YidD [Candidatus Gottesmanbacteria bacterium]|nr:membrane protein insertion efficiency factor YidD [Candidatus Gottesmanbacteria bacterium]
MRKKPLSIFQKSVLSLVTTYQKSSKHLFRILGVSSPCRFQPSCSSYMYEAIIRYGTIWGFTRGILRILRCHPWGGKGYDPVT